MKNKEFSKNNLSKFYYVSPLFKRYCKSGLWFGSIEEFNNIRYCEKYLQKYVHSKIKNNLLCYMKPSSYMILVADPYIIKFLESRFFSYINLHFFLCFYSNSFLSSFAKSKIEIETFVDYYYNNFLKKKLEKDLLSCIIKSTNKFRWDLCKICLIDQRFYCFKKKSNYRKKVTIEKNNKNLGLGKSAINLYLKRKNIQILFESTDSFSSFKRKKESIGFYNTLNVLYDVKSE